jgi:hypothetical protein
MLGKRWKPNYATIEEAPAENMSPVSTIDDSDSAEQKKKKRKKSQQLSTKGIVSKFENIFYLAADPPVY